MEPRDITAQHTTPANNAVSMSRTTHDYSCVPEQNSDYGFSDEEDEEPPQQEDEQAPEVVET